MTNPPADSPPPPSSRAPSPAAVISELPFSWPTTLSGWLIGVGSVVAALGLIASLDRAVSALLFLTLLWIAASVFLAHRIPEIPRQRFAVLAATLIGLGVALDRAGFTVRGWDTAFLIGMLAAAGGALLIELDRDRPMPPPEPPRR
jgi:hypothetical protein